MNKEELYRKSEDYFKNKLSPEEKLAFETVLANDSVLAKEVQLHNRMMEAISERHVTNFRSVVKDSLAEREAKSTATRDGFKQQWVYLIVLAIIIGLFLYLNNRLNLISENSIRGAETEVNSEQNTNTNTDNSQQKSLEGQNKLEEEPSSNIPPSTPNHKQITPNTSKQAQKTQASDVRESIKRNELLAMDYYEIPPSILPGNSTEQTKRDPAKSSLLEEIRIEFNRGLIESSNQPDEDNEHYHKSILLLDSLIVRNQNQTAIFYRGHVFFHLQRYEEASDDFSSTITSLKYGKQAEWYLLLSRIASGKDYQEELNMIVTNQNHPFYEETMSIKKVLDK